MFESYRFSTDLKLHNNTFVFVRHGNTHANLTRICMGRLDYDIDTIGRKQSEAFVKTHTPDHVFVSPLRRALTTAKIIYPQSKLLIDNRLIERSGGDIDGMPYDDVAKLYPELWYPERYTPESALELPFPNGESNREVIFRLESFINEQNDRYSDRTIGVVTHSGVIQAARFLFGASFETIFTQPIDNCASEIFCT